MQMESIPCRSFKLARSGHFDAAHFLPEYNGKCSEMHGHRWEVTAELEYPMVPIDYLHGPDADGMLVDFADISELWLRLDHTTLNDRFPDPTAEMVAVKLLDELYCLAAAWTDKLAFRATITLWESPDSVVSVSTFRGAATSTFEDFTQTVGAQIGTDPGMLEEQETVYREAVTL